MITKSIVLIGPITPYRGGIAQHTTMLRQALKKLTIFHTISFTRQYPSLLFPGESDKEPNQKYLKENDVEYLIDSLNPISWHKAVRRCIELNASLVIIPWWTIYWAPCFGYISLFLKLNKIPVLFFCHNVIEHESLLWKSFITKYVLNNASRFVVHTKMDALNLRKILPAANIITHAHPVYDQFPSPKIKLPKRAKLELLFYGFIRPYKGLDILIEAMQYLQTEDIKLTIVGEFWNNPEETEKRIHAFNLESKIELIPRYISDEESANYFDRADVVVLPYRSATGSGVIPLAYHYNKPVIVTNVGGLPDVVENNKTGFIVPPENPLELANAILKINTLDRSEVIRNIEIIKAKLTWESLAKSILSTQLTI